MLKQRQALVFVLSVLVIGLLCLPHSDVTAQTKTSAVGTSTNFNQAADNALAAAKEELRGAARAHRVSIQVDRLLYASDGKTTIVHAPVTGIEKYKIADFVTGAPILFVIVKSTLRLGLPNGSYVVRAQYKPGAISGKVTFTDRNGAVSAQRDLIVRTWKQSAVLFPGAYTDPPPVGIPNITSSHVIIWENGVRHYYFDCSGINGTLYFEMG